MDGRKVRWLNIIDEHDRVCLASVPRRSWRGSDVINVLSEIMILGARRNTSEAITVLSSSPRDSESGFLTLALSQHISSREALGKTDLLKASTLGCATSS